MQGGPPLFDAWRLAQVGADVMAMTQAPPWALAARQRERLRALLQAARSGSRLYREHLRGVGDDAALDDLPTIGRHELMARFDDWVADPALSLSALRDFTADPTAIARSFGGRYHVWESSGTSGQPGVFVHDVGAMAVYDALEALRRSQPRPIEHWFDPFGVGERYAFVGAIDGHFA